MRLAESKEFETLSQLEKVSIGDTVTVEYPALGVSSTLRVVKTVYDSLNEKYLSIDLGKAKQTIVKMLSSVSKEVENVITTQQTAMQAAANHATQKITGGLGGYVIINPNESTGYPDEILIMNTADKTTATNVIRINKNGIGFSTSGYDGTYTTAWTIDGHFVADFITSGTLNANLLKAGTIQDTTGTTSIDLSTGVITINQTNNRGSISISSSGIDFDYGGTNKMRLFVQRSGEPILICEGQPTIELGSNFKVINGSLSITTGTVTGDWQINGDVKVGGYTFSPRNLTIDGNTYTILGT